MAAAEPTMRDVNQHILFEVATEVANRGAYLETNDQLHRIQLLTWISSSRWYLLGAEVESTSHNS
jgi:hypothetical protein